VKIAPVDKPALSIDMTPLIDVVFLLLIFFMVSTTFDRYSKMNIELPEASVQETEQVPTPLEVIVDAKGNVFIDSKKVVSPDVAIIREALLRRLQSHKERAVLLSADANARHADVVRVMDAAAQANVVNLSIATVRGSGED